MHMPAASTAAPGIRASTYAWYVAGILAIGHLVSFLDRFVMSLALVPIKAEMHMSDTQLGLLVGLGFVILYSLVGVPLGLLADRVNRRNLIAAGIFFWSLATAACAFAESFHGLFLARLGVGLGEAALVPAAMSLIGAYFAKDQLARAVSIFTTGASLGRTVAFIGGAAILGWLTPKGGIELPLLGVFRPWQALFLAASLPGFLLVILLFTVREPARIAQPKTSRQSLAGVAQHLGANRRAYLLHLVASCSTIILVQTIAAWAPSMFNRLHAMSGEDSGYVVGTVSLLAGIAGNLFGGWLTDRNMSRGMVGAPGVTIALALLLSAPVALVFYLTRDRTVAIVAFVVMEFLTTCASPPSLAGIQMLTPGRYRGIVSSIFLCIVTLVAVGLGPTLIGVATDRIFGDPNKVGYSLLGSNLIFALLGAGFALWGRRSFHRTVLQTNAAEIPVVAARTG